MDLFVEQVDVWAASVEDHPGGLAQILTGLREAGTDLDFIIARRSSGKDGQAVVFVTPLRSDREVEAAADLGFNVTSSVHSLRIEGQNELGIAAAITDKLARSGINLHGFSAAVMGARFVIYIGFDSAEEAEKATEILQKV